MRDEPRSGFEYDEREAYLHQEEQRQQHDSRMREGPIEVPVVEPEPAPVEAEMLKQRIILELESLMRYKLHEGRMTYDRHGDFIFVAAIDDLLACLKGGEI